VGIVGIISLLFLRRIFMDVRCLPNALGNSLNVHNEIKKLLYCKKQVTILLIVYEGDYEDNSQK
jgi:hypothetical protein